MGQNIQPNNDKFINKKIFNHKFDKFINSIDNFLDDNTDDVENKKYQHFLKIEELEKNKFLPKQLESITNL